MILRDFQRKYYVSKSVSFTSVGTYQVAVLEFGLDMELKPAESKSAHKLINRYNHPKQQNPVLIVYIDCVKLATGTVFNDRMQDLV